MTQNILNIVHYISSNYLHDSFHQIKRMQAPPRPKRVREHIRESKTELEHIRKPARQIWYPRKSDVSDSNLYMNKLS